MPNGPARLYDIPRHQTDPLNGVYRSAAGLFMGIFLSFWIATEVAANKLGYQPALGTPMAKHIYEPWAGMFWLAKFHSIQDARVQAAFTAEIDTLLICLGASVVLAGLVMARALRKISRKSDLHGSAHWATPDEIKRSGLLDGAGVYVGAIADDRGNVRYLRDDGPSHVLAFAPTRSGKGVGLVIPTLLSWPHSVVVHDIKGENFALTSGWRERELNSRILRFEPTSVGGSIHFNPLAEVRLGTDYEVQDVQNIVGIITDPDGRGADSEEAHWIATSSAFLLGVILHVLYYEKEKSLSGVAGLISNPAFQDARQLYSFLSAAEHDPELKYNWRDMDGAATMTHPVVAMAAQEMANRDPKEATSILSTAIRFLTLWRDPIVARNTRDSDFRIGDLMNDARPQSLYIIVPPSDIDRIKPLTRLLLNQIMRTLTNEMKFEGGRSVAHYKHRLLMMIDEFPSLGRLEIMQQGLAFMAGYGIKAYLIAQDVSQLAAAYGGASGRDETIMANCHIQVAFAPNKIETMDLLSKMAGNTTVRTETKSYSGGRMSVRNHVMVNSQETERPLITPDEVRRLPDEDALIFVAGQSPIYGKKIRYYEDRTFSERARIPAPAQIDRAAVAAPVVPVAAVPAASDVTDVPDAASSEVMTRG